MPRKHGLENRPPKKPRPFFPEKKTVVQLGRALDSAKREIQKIEVQRAGAEKLLESLLVKAHHGTLSSSQKSQKERLLAIRNRLYRNRDRLDGTQKKLEAWIKEAKIRQLMLSKPRR